VIVANSYAELAEFLALPQMESAEPGEPGATLTGEEQRLVAALRAMPASRRAIVLAQAALPDRAIEM